MGAAAPLPFHNRREIDQERFEMKKPLFILLSILTLMTLACGVTPNVDVKALETKVVQYIPTTIVGSGKVITDNRPVSGFNQLQFATTGHMTIIQGAKEALTIKGDDNIVKLIHTEVTNHVLKISMDNNLAINADSLTFTLMVKNLSKVELSGFGDIKSEGLKSDAFQLDLTGAGSLNLQNVAFKSMKVTMSGFGSADLQGTAASETVTITGAGSYMAGDLKSSTAEFNLGGLGNAQVWATDTLQVSITGAGNLEYYGKPKLTQNVTGIGRVKSLGNK
jgi:hypothetical protein